MNYIQEEQLVNNLEKVIGNFSLVDNSIFKEVRIYLKLAKIKNLENFENAGGCYP